MRQSFALLILLFLGGPVFAQTASEKKPDAPRASQKIPSPAEQLDKLYQRLKTAKTPEEGSGVLNQIGRFSRSSPSPTASLLLDRANALAATGDLPLASELMEQVLKLAPQWPYAWQIRAALFRMSDDPERAAIALLKALSLEPRSYKALELLGTIYAEGDDEKSALIAYRKALDLYPASSELQEIVRKLSLSAEGKAL